MISPKRILQRNISAAPELKSAKTAGFRTENWSVNWNLAGHFVGNAFMRSETFRDEHGPLNGKNNDYFVGNGFIHSES